MQLKRITKYQTPSGPLPSYLFNVTKYKAPEKYTDTIEPAVITATLPEKFHGSQAAAARYAAGQKWGKENINTEKFLDEAAALGINTAGTIGLGIAAATNPEITIPAAIGGILGSNLTNKIIQNKTGYDTWGEWLSKNNKSHTIKTISEFTNPGGLLFGIVGGKYGKSLSGIKSIINNTINYYSGLKIDPKISKKLGISNGIWELPLHKAFSNSRIGKILTYYTMRINGGDKSGSSLSIPDFIQMFSKDNDKWGITNSSLTDNYKIGLFRKDPILSRMFHLDKLKYTKTNSKNAISANTEVGNIINQSIPENIQGIPAVNNTNADIYSIDVEPILDGRVYISRVRPSYKTKKSKDGWIPAGSSSGRTYGQRRPFSPLVNADLGGHWEKGISGEPIKIYDWNHFTPAAYITKWNTPHFLQIHGLTGINRMWNPFAFYGETKMPTEYYLNLKRIQNAN